MNNQKRTACILLIVLTLVWVSVLGYTIFIKQLSAPTIPTTVEPVSTASLEKHTILIKKIPISFELPKGYAVFQREGFEGDYATSIIVGKEIAGGHFMYAPLEIELFPRTYDMQLEREYFPKEYIDVVFSEQGKDSASNPQYVELFGNKAVKYTNAADESISIVGYLREDQLPELSQEYLVRISSFTYGSGAGTDTELFDAVVNSLRINK
jgi:hypothetical protein